MKLSEVFKQLAYGELSQVNLGQLADGSVDEANIPALVSHINLGLSALYKRFKIKEGRMYLPMIAPTTVYKLMVTDLNKIEQVFTLEGTELSLNDGSDPYSCFTPQMGTLRVPQAIVTPTMEVPTKYRTSSLLVIYRATHPTISLEWGSFDLENTELELPDVYMEALLYFVASRVHNPIGMVNEFNAGNNWAMKYENECTRLKDEGLEINQDIPDSFRIHRGGWV